MRRTRRLAIAAAAVTSLELGASVASAAPGPTLTYAKVIAALAIACLALVEPAFAMHPPGGLRPHPLEGCRRPSAPVRCRARIKLPPGYGPRQIRRAYRIQPLLDAGKDGS